MFADETLLKSWISQSGHRLPSEPISFGSVIYNGLENVFRCPSLIYIAPRMILGVLFDNTTN